MLNIFKKKAGAQKQSFHLGNLVEILQDGVCISNVEGDILYLNKAAYNLLDVDDSHELQLINFFDQLLLEPAQIEQLKKQLNQQGLVRNFELKIKRFTAGDLDVILTINIIGDFRQQTIGLLFLFKDISELKKIQQQLLQSQKLESVGLMASGIAHDFNNILAAIIPNAELIKIGLEKTKENYKRAEIIEKSAHRASEIAQRLLTFTRHNEKIPQKAINLNQVLTDSMALLEHSLPKNVKVISLPGKELNYVMGDKAELQQIVMNMVINAVDAMPEGGKIHLKTENFNIKNYYDVGSLEPGDYIKLSIQDEGTGIPLELQHKIFDPFFTTKEVGKGTGLGLSVVYGIVTSMKGHVELDSQPDKGTRFDIYFPISQVEPNEKIKQGDLPFEPGDIRLLLVDDEEYVLNILSDILEFLGYRVWKKEGGRKAVSFFREHASEIDVAIIDLRMPGMDGRTTALELRKINPALQIIFTSGFDDGPSNDEIIQGLVGFLKKPYSINQVAKTLQDILLNQRSRIAENK
ncbi:MAG: ATP-binding protein [Calditrichia bacterium]